MRVLFVYFNYPQLSATYVEAEIRFLQRHGIDVEVWSETNPGSPYEPSCRVHRGTLSEADVSFKPDIIHFYWVKMLVKYLDQVSCPHITVRDHSFGVDAEEIAHLQMNPRVKAMFLFPHEAEGMVSSEKIVALPVAYDSVRFPPNLSHPKSLDVVAGCTAGLPKKALEVFFETAALCRDLRFILALANCTGHRETIEHCVDLNRRLGNPVDLHIDLPHPEIVPLLREAGCYLCTQLASKRGMPIAIAEALANGCYVLVPRFPWLEEMIGDCGTAYENAAQAADLLTETRGWSEQEWDRVASNAASYAYAKFSDDFVLPQLVQI